MAKALLIAGDSKRFLDEVLLMRDFLRHEAGIADIAVIKTAYLPFWGFRRRVSRFLEKSRKEPLLILYSGHGSETKEGSGGGWQLSDSGNIFPYDELVKMLRGHPAPVLIVNDCCFAFGLAAELKKELFPPERFSVIASSGAHEVGYTGIVKRLIESWRFGLPLLGQATLQEVIRIAHVRDWREKLEDFAKLCLVDLSYFIHPKLFRAIFGGPVTLHYDKRILRTHKVEIVLEKRWGEVFDRYFCAKDPRFDSVGTICLPKVGDLVYADFLQKTRISFTCRIAE
jgi:hypothetical protein